MTQEEIDETMQKALKAVRAAAPDLPVIAVIAFPTDDNQTCVFTGGNMQPEIQKFILSVAIEGLNIKSNPESATPH